MMPNPNRKKVVSRAPQRSILGHLIFLILISDIDEEILESFVSSFSDITWIGYPIGDPNDTAELQIDLNSIFNLLKQHEIQHWQI